MKDRRVVLCTDPTVYESASFRAKIRAMEVDAFLEDSDCIVLVDDMGAPSIASWLLTLPEVHDDDYILKASVKPDYHSIGRSHNQKRKY